MVIWLYPRLESLHVYNKYIVLLQRTEQQQSNWRNTFWARVSHGPFWVVSISTNRLLWFIWNIWVASQDRTDILFSNYRIMCKLMELLLGGTESYPRTNWRAPYPRISAPLQPWTSCKDIQAYCCPCWFVFYVSAEEFQPGFTSTCHSIWSDFFLTFLFPRDLHGNKLNGSILPDLEKLTNMTSL